MMGICDQRDIGAADLINMKKIALNIQISGANDGLLSTGFDCGNLGGKRGQNEPFILSCARVIERAGHDQRVFW